jgi:hypothetical protein
MPPDLKQLQTMTHRLQTVQALMKIHVLQTAHLLQMMRLLQTPDLP